MNGRNMGSQRLQPQIYGRVSVRQRFEVDKLTGGRHRYAGVRPRLSMS